MPVRARIEPDVRATDEIGTVHQPDRGRAVVGLPQDVRLAVAVEIGGCDHVPGRPWIEAHIGSREDVRAVHQPHRRCAIGILPKNVGLAVTVEIAGADRVP